MTLPNWRKTSAIFLLVSEKRFDVIAVTEVMMKNLCNDIDTFVLPGYTCMTVTQGRGVSLFVKECLDVFRLYELEKCFNPSILCKVTLPDKESYVFGVLYRSPNCTEEENGRVNVLINKLFEDHGTWEGESDHDW